MPANLILKEEAYAIIGACFEVYNEIGSGFLEDVYQECLELEFANRRIPAIAKPSLELHYKGTKLRKGYQPDFVCNAQIVVEIKAQSHLIDEHRSQVINYLHASGFELGLLVNFGCHRELEWQRFVRSPRTDPPSDPPRLQS